MKALEIMSTTTDAEFITAAEGNMGSNGSLIETV